MGNALVLLAHALGQELQPQSGKQQPLQSDKRQPQLLEPNAAALVLVGAVLLVPVLAIMIAHPAHAIHRLTVMPQPQPSRQV
jgi:hypothetical protein